MVARVQQGQEDMARRLMAIEQKIDSHFVSKSEFDGSKMSQDKDFQRIDEEFKKVNSRISKLESTIGWFVKAIVGGFLAALATIVYKSGLRL